VTSRLLIAGTHSSVGKTTVTLGLLAALRRQGVQVAPFKAGPDYIDPSLHTLAAGTPSRNLDTWLLDEPALARVFQRGTRNADVAVIEGVMGLFDGIGATQMASTAALARLLDCPVLLVLDVAAMSGTAAALVLGCQAMQPPVKLAGVLLNRVGSDHHAAAASEAITQATGLPVLGSLPKDPGIAIPERHLGLVPAAEDGLSGAVLERLADIVTERFDLTAIRRIADSAGAWRHACVEEATPRARHSVRIAVALDSAFGFYYQDTFDALAEHGAELVPFSPLEDQTLPSDVGGVYLGGGYPELYARELSANRSMRDSLQLHTALGLPIYAECGGLMALGRTLTTFEGEKLPMFGLLPVDSRMQLQTLSIGYTEVEALRSSAVLPTGGRVRGHEFHWSVADAPSKSDAAYQVLGSDRLEGFCVGSVLGSYVHLNFAGRPDIADRFVSVCARREEYA
jgi:cobyrinic acid a,c-diamide synthase